MVVQREIAIFASVRPDGPWSYPDVLAGVR